MAHVQATDKAISWAATVSGVVIYAGTLEQGGAVYAPALWLVV